MLPEPIKKGIGFGLTSGVITTLGLIIGLGVSTASKTAVIGGIVTIALADSLSDSLGMHISEESEKDVSHKEIWLTTAATLLTKIFFTSTFIIPVLSLPMNWALIFCSIWGVSLLMVFSYYLADQHNEKHLHVMAEHFFVASLVITFTYLIGSFVS